ncbi:hypothetical protein LOTGIDRAFT_170814 [Lottia gigantea]|uniref:Uncharacterized protein n=1 Tax=Lottia gigantea TaxID=225164 RepID=V4BAD1_LOTGI|nr:hypothetical protein LOTGIDRAFT_170814 [Lottia gigantea]ESP04421.1 hypothetical protein LOTGIDRAFT_170814 [Lottia gigantea]
MEAKPAEEEHPKLVIPKSGSFSPKVTRPKLPVFATNKRSTSPRHKTDPGHGQIQAIMQDILNLNKVDFVKTYSRPVTLRSQIAQKSQSTDTTPSSTPRTGSPVTVGEEQPRINRNRSRSLKLLTNKLRKYGPDDKALMENPAAVSEEVKAHMMEVEKNSLPGDDVDEMTRSTDSESKSCDSPAPEREPVGAARKISQGTAGSVDDDSYDIIEESDEHTQSGNDTDNQPTNQTGHETPKIIAEDEGIVSDEHPSPVVSSFTYHPIGRNSPFLKLAASAPCSKRRTGITTLKTLNRVQTLYGSGKYDEGKGHEGLRQPRRDSPNAQKVSPVRFITHQPVRKTSSQEEGSMDSNGFAALKSSSGDSDDEGKHSQTSLADSHLSPCDGDEVESIPFEGSTAEGGDPDKQDRKNGKSVKPKSKSDPGRNKIVHMGDFPIVTESSVSQSAPLLSKEDRMDSLDEDYHGSEEELKSEYLIIGEESANERTSDEDEKSGTRRKRRSRDTLSPPNQGRSSVFSSAPPSPKCQSPTNVPEPSDNLLSVPTPRKPILRSASSASVLQRERLKFGSSSKDKSDVFRKHSITTEDGNKGNMLVPDFTPLGDSGGATSMPSVWRDRILSSVSPERDPGFVKAFFPATHCDDHAYLRLLKCI